MGIFGSDPLRFNILGHSSTQPPQEWRKPASPGEVQSFGQTALHAGVTGLGAVLDVFDRPRRALTGLAMGKPRELLSILPGSDSLGLTDPNQATSGADVNKALFGLKKDNSWGSWGAGLATELVTDPLNWASFGGKALTQQGLKAAKAGLTRPLTRLQKAQGFAHAADTFGGRAEDLAHLARKGETVAPAGSGIAAKAPLTGVIRLHAPFMPSKGVTLGAGSKTAERMARFGDAAQEAAFKVPGIKTAGALFHEPFKRATMREAQKGMKATQPIREAAEAGVRGSHADLQDEIAKLVEQGTASGNWGEKELSDALRMRAESQVPSSVLPVHPELWKLTEPFGQWANQFAQETPRSARRLGINQKNMDDDYISYFRRQLASKTPGNPAAQPATKLFQNANSSMRKRKDIYRNKPGGTAMWNKLSADPTLAGANAVPEAADKILDAYLGHLGKTRPVITPPAAVVPPPAVVPLPAAAAPPRSIVEAMHEAVMTAQRRPELVNQGFTDKALIHDVWEQFAKMPEGKGMSLDQFKDNLAHGSWRHEKGFPVVSRADMAHLFPPEVMKAAETEFWPFGKDPNNPWNRGATWHWFGIPGEMGGARSPATPLLFPQYLPGAKAAAAIPPAAAVPPAGAIPPAAPPVPGAPDPNEWFYKLQKQAAQAARRLKKHDPARGPIFNQDIAADYALRAGQKANTESSVQAFYKTAGEAAQPFKPGMVRMSELVSGIKGNPQLKPFQLHTFASPRGIEGAKVEIHKALAKHGAGITEDLISKLMNPVHAAKTLEDRERALRRAKGGLTRAINKFGVTPEQAQGILKDYGSWRMPGELEHTIPYLDALTNTFRNQTYGIWPASHVRNATGGAVQSLARTGLSSLKAIPDQIRLLKGTLDPARLAQYGAATPQGLKNQQYAAGKIFSGINPNEVKGGVPGIPGQIFQPPPGTAEPWMNTGQVLGGFAKGWRDLGVGVAKTLGRPIETLRNPKNAFFGPGSPFEQAGIAGGVRNNPLLEHGRKVGTQVENTLRGAQYLGQVGQGVDPFAAGRETLATHFDYSGGLTPFERNVMRRIVPFYTYASRNLPLQLQNLTQTPWAVTPQLRLAASGHGSFVPQHLASGVAIPVGQEDEQGQQRFISQLGLPAEEAFERLKTSGGDPGSAIRDTLMAYAGSLNPLIKAPLEQLTNTQFFSGRKLSDLRPQGTVGGVANLLDPEQQHPVIQQLISQGLANTPFTRFITATDKLTDPRKPWWAKALNLGTGVRISDVDMEKSRAIEQRQYLEKLMLQDPKISQHASMYVKPENQASLSPETIDQLQIYAAMQAQAQEAAKRRRQAQAFR